MREANKDDLETVEWLVGLRWPKVRACPHCGERDSSEMIKTRALFQCLTCRKQYGVFTGTMFQGTRLSPLDLSFAILSFWDGSYDHDPNFYKKIKVRYPSYIPQQRSNWFISVRCFSMAIGNYATAQRLHKKLVPHIKKNMSIEEFLESIFKSKS